MTVSGATRCEVNPFTTHVSDHRQQFSINLWDGIVQGHLIGLYFLLPHLNKTHYLEFIRDVLPESLGNRFPNCWIRQGGPIPWPAQLPGITPLDIFLWRHIKSLVYETPIDTNEELLTRVLAACLIVQQTPELFERVQQNFMHLLRLVVTTLNTCSEL